LSTLENTIALGSFRVIGVIVGAVEKGDTFGSSKGLASLSCLVNALGASRFAQGGLPHSGTQWLLVLERVIRSSLRAHWSMTIAFGESGNRRYRWCGNYGDIHWIVWGLAS